MISEVPFLYGKSEGRSLRFNLQAEGKIQRVVCESNIRNSNSSLEWSSENHLVGSCSVSSLTDGSHVATLALGSSLISVIHGNHRIEIDFHSLYPPEGESLLIARVECFEDSKGNQLELMIAVAKATIYRIEIEKDSLIPTKYDELVVPQLLEKQGIDYSGAELHTTMIHFISSTTAIMALSPFIFTINIGSSKIFLWSLNQVQEATSTSMSSILNRAGSILLGEPEVGDSTMAPVSALSVCHDAVFTLHANASILQWKLDDISSYIKPKEVYCIDCPIPSAQNWVTTAAPFSFAVTSTQENRTGEFIVVIHIETRNEGSNLFILQGSNVVKISEHFIVPSDAGSVTALHLQSPTPNLVVLATKRDTSHRKSHVQLQYPYPFSSNTLSTKRTESSFLTLDSVAQVEWDRLEAFEEEDIEKVDRLALQYLFLPRYPRATGTMTGPSSTTVQAAVIKLVPGYVWDQQSSLPVQALCAMQHWRKTEKSCQMMSKNAQGSILLKGESVYESFAESAAGLMEIENENHEMIFINQRDQQDTTNTHIRRWKTFIRTILEHEAKYRCPLRLETLSVGNSTHTILMRSSLVSLLLERQDKVQNTKFSFIDEEAMKLLSKVEEKNPLKLKKLEIALMEIVTSMSLVLREDNESLTQIQAEMQSLGFLAYQFPDISCVLRDMTPDELQAYIETVPNELLFQDAPIKVPLTSKVDRTIAVTDTRHGAASLVIRGVDAMRRLTIGRCLLIMAYCKDEHKIQNMVFTKYLHILASLWAFSQHVPMPSSISASIEDTPPQKRLSFSDNDQNSILLDNNQKTTALDVHLIQVSQKLSFKLPPHDMVMFLAESVLKSTFRENSCNATSQYMLLPELGCLPAPLKEEIASDYPRLALRLLATKIAFPLLKDSVSTRMARVEAIAECLLIEANDSPFFEVMRERASYLLDHGDEMEKTDPLVIGETYDRLIAAAREITPVGDMIDADHRMMVKLQGIVHGTTTQKIRKDIRCLCAKESVRNVFLPFFLNGGLPNWEIFEHNSIKLLLCAFLHLSNLIDRLSIIERRTERLGRLGRSDHPGNLVAQTNRTILEIQSLFPERIYILMSEYVNLWSLLFRHAVAARDWSTAIQSCINNPNAERKIKNFDQLVKGMVETGAMGELLDICTVTGTGAFDLYEIATDALVSGGLGNRFAIESKTPDYLGCLFALHANSGRWKRAAQAMDLRYGDALVALNSSRLGTINNDIAAVDLSLSSIATSFALHLVSDNADRYIVSGESGSCPQIALLSDTNEVETSKSILKRGHDRQTIVKKKYPSPVKDDRLSRFMTFVDVEARAIRSVAFETVFLDSDAIQLPISLLSKPSPSNDRKIIDRLASFGFYSIAFLTSHVMAKYCKEKFGSNMPMGRDRLHDAYSHIVLTYLIKIACDNEDSFRGNLQEKPTLPQLQYSLNEVCSYKMLTGSTYVACPRYGSKQLIIQAMQSSTAMVLIRQIVLNRDRAADPIALEVADELLKLSDAALPRWLESRLSGEVSNSLFTNIKETQCFADPSALCTLYMEQGRYVDACNLVSKILFGKDNGKLRKSTASFLVPEKGGLIYVPYNKIDLLWNLVDNALRLGDIAESIKSQLRVSRLRMEQALEFHFSLLKISEDGLKSARVLTREA
mmetsp:Transcript_40667/g.46222  ORF Transcript_40667/g.46222 Transcript_40667/m.46222 type:complete len:1642 (-) Transcript_40667:215-5140(-)